MSSYSDFVESVISRLSKIDMFNTYLSSEERVRNQKVYDGVCLELNSRMQSDDRFVVEMYYWYITRGYFISPQLDWSLINGAFSDLSSVKEDTRLYRLYQEAEKLREEDLSRQRASLIEKLKARRITRRVNKRKA